MALKKSQLYSSLWQSCDELRGGMDASQYKDFVLTLLFMKYVSDKYAGKPGALIEVPEGGSFADMAALRGHKEIGDRINKIIGRLAEANDLKGVIDQADFNDESKLGSGKEMQDRLSKLVAIFDGLDFRANRAHGDDLLGDAYEYLMLHFATESGKSKGQFYTPAEVSRIMAKVIGIKDASERDQPTVYDPTCGSGSLLIKAADEAATRTLSIYGQEKDVATWSLARMNMILHNHPTADLRRGNTLSVPSFKDDDRGLRTFDFAVANPPFSDKAWSNGLDPANDEFERFECGSPPAKNGDYAFLLHLVKSLKSTGKGAIIMPHGVLFRGNREADIRRNLVRRGWIKGVIGLPANLFYGTGIPACIIVIDKENAVARDGVFMIDASKSFRKDGAKNRLRERDIHRIVDTFNEQKEVLGYARMVAMAEIASDTNDYNLTIRRYMDSSDAEDVQDLHAHLQGGIPNRDLDALGDYWEVFPAIRSRLFAPNGREGYSDARVEADEVRSTILEHEEFKAYAGKIRHVLDGWRKEHAPRLGRLDVGDSPKLLIRELSEDLLRRFSGLPLVDRYAVYQCLLDYWDDTMQDDVYLVVTEGWSQAARPQALALARRKKATETADLTVKGKKYRMDLLPPDLVVARYFVAERAAVDRLRTEEERIARELEEHIEENSGEDGLLDGATSDTGKVTQTAVKARLKEVVPDPEACDEREALDVCLELLIDLASARKSTNTAQAEMDAKVLLRYLTLTGAEVVDTVVDAKWMASIEAAIGHEVEHLIGGLVDRVRELETRYAETLPELEQRVEDYGTKVEGHLRRMGLPT